MDWDKELGIIAIATIAICAMFLIPIEAAQIVNPAIAAIAGFVAGRAKIGG